MFTSWSDPRKSDQLPLLRQTSVSRNWKLECQEPNAASASAQDYCPEVQKSSSLFDYILPVAGIAIDNYRLLVEHGSRHSNLSELFTKQYPSEAHTLGRRSQSWDDHGG